MRDEPRKGYISSVSISVFAFFAFSAFQIMFESGSSIIKNGLLFAFLICVVFINRRFSFPKYKISFFLVFSLAYMAISFAFSSGLSNLSLGRLKAVIIISAVSLLFFALCKFANNFDSIVFGFSIIMLAATLKALFSLGFSNIITLIVYGTRIIDVYGTEYGTNYSAMIACIEVLLFVFYALKKRNWLYYLLTIPGFVLCMASGSRKALISAILGILLLLFLMSKKKNAYTLIKWILILSVIIFIMYQIPFFDAITKRITTLWNSGLDEKVGISDAGRLNRITWGLSQFIKSPVWGYGFDSFAYHYGNSFGIASYAHNNYVQILFDQGLIGFLLYYGYIFQIVKELFVLRKDENKCCILLLSLCVISLVFDLGSVTYYQYLSRLIYMLAGGYIYYRKTRLFNTEI